MASLETLMSTHNFVRRSRPLIALAAAASLLMVAGCASSGGAEPSGSTMPTSGNEAMDQSIHDLLPEDVRSSGVVTIGVTPEDPPFLSKVDGEYVGIIPELMDEVSAVMGVEFKLEELPFPGLIPAIQAGKIDYAWTSMFDTVEREEVLDFSSYAAANFGLLVQKGNPKDINFLEDLCGTVASTTKGTVMATALEEQKAKCAAEGKPDMRISLYDSQSAAHVQLKAGQVDSFLGTATPLTYLAENAEGGAVFEMAEGSYPAGYLAVGSSKTEKGLAEAMSAALLAIEKDGAYAAVFDKYSAANDVLPTDLIVVNGRTSGVLK